jgi:hypothetical protein
LTEGTYSSDVHDELGIDPDTASWKEYAACHGLDTNYFYDYYESDPVMARTIDQTCLSCPIMKQCLQMGIENGEWGVWGGIYLTSGKKDTNKNAHKTKEDWDAIARRIAE